MKQRGQKPAAADNVVDIAVASRPRPPDDLTEGEKLFWNDVVAGRPADFFEFASLPLLAEYCRTKTEVDFIAESIREFKHEWMNTEDGLKRYEKLSVMRTKAQTRLMALATKMRLTQQSRYVPHSKNNRTPTRNGPKPWEVD